MSPERNVDIRHVSRENIRRNPQRLILVGRDSIRQQERQRIAKNSDFTPQDKLGQWARSWRARQKQWSITLLASRRCLFFHTDTGTDGMGRFAAWIRISNVTVDRGGMDYFVARFPEREDLWPFYRPPRVEEAAFATLNFVEILIMPPPANPLRIMPIKQDTERYGWRRQDANSFTLDILLAQPFEDGRLDRRPHY
jgi:hypothetical protein